MGSIDRSRKLDVAIASVRKFAHANATSKVVNVLVKFRAADVAAILSSLSADDRRVAWRALRRNEPSLAAEVLTEMPGDHAVSVLGALEPKELGGVLHSLPVDDAAYLVGLLPDDILDSLQEEDDLDKTLTPQLVGQLTYEEQTAGRIMSTKVLAVAESMTAGEAIRSIQDRSDELEVIFYLYVVDARQHLVGVVSLRQILLVPPSTPLRQIMLDDVISVRTDTDQEEVAQTIARYNLLAIPVVDAENRLVGMITVDDAIDVIRDEATEDIYALAGVATEERVTGGPLRAIRLRLPWLLMNLVTTAGPAFVVSLFQDTIKEVVVLAVLASIVPGMGGNGATQTFTVVIRGLALGELEATSRMRVLLKELTVGLGTGVTNGIVVAIGVSILFQNVWLGVVIGAAMVINLLVAGAVGTLVPLILRAMRIDPALASSVIVTTFTDSVGYGAFYAIATMLISRLPHSAVM